jgi:ABC-type branched-subunit amino acid transport system ATPase component
VREINRRERIAVLVVEQNLEFVARLGAHCHLVDKGRIVFDCTAQRLAEDAALHREYLGV